MNKPHYLDRCRKIMLSAQTFHNGDTIRNLFELSDLLREHANYLELPAQPSPSNYVDAVLAHLTRYPARKVDLLIELLRLLHDRTPDSSIQIDIRTMQTELEKLRRAELAVIVAAMTDGQAATILDHVEDAERPEDHTRRDLARLLFAPGADGFGLDLDSLRRCYKDEPDQWEPFGGGKSIIEILDEIKESLVPCQSRPLPPITHADCSRLIFGAAPRLTDLRAELSSRACLLVIDAVSMLHQGIREALRESRLHEVTRTAVIVLTPRGNYMKAVQHLHSLIMEEVAEAIPDHKTSFTGPADLLLEFGIADDMTLRRRLRAIVPQLLRDDLGFQASTITMNQTHMGRYSTGLGDAVFA